MLRKTGSAQIRWQWRAHFLRLHRPHSVPASICWLVSYPPPSSLLVEIGAIFQGLAQVFPLKPFLSLSAWLNLFSLLPPNSISHLHQSFDSEAYATFCLVVLARLKKKKSYKATLFVWCLYGSITCTVEIIMCWWSKATDHNPFAPGGLVSLGHKHIQ